ncbi:MAG TPA: hypothetical protein VFL97_07220 [Nitrococcus sp.]|nr:hypothetical protein [Nitrococcus sp.]
MTTQFLDIVEWLSALSEDELDTPEGRRLFDEFLFHAPPELQTGMRAKFKELFPELPAPALCGSNGERLWTDQQLADYLGVSVEDVRERIAELSARGLMPGLSDPSDVQWLN